MLLARRAGNRKAVETGTGSQGQYYTAYDIGSFMIHASNTASIRKTAPAAAELVSEHSIGTSS